MINYKEKYLKYKKKYLNLKKKLGGSNVDDINLNLEDNYLNKKKLVLANKIALIAYDILKDYDIISKINDLFDSLDQEIKVDFSIKEKKIKLIENINNFKQINKYFPKIIPDTILLIKEIIESSHTKIDLKNKIFEWLKKYYSKNSLVNIANKLVIKNVFLLEDNNINKKKLVLANEIAIIAHDILIDDAKISEKINDFYNSLNQEIKDNFLIEKKKCELIGNIDKFKQLNIDLPEIIPDTILLIKEIIESSYTNIDLKNEKIIAWLKKYSIQYFELLLEKEQAETAAEAETKDKLFLEVRKRKGIEIPEAYKELEKKIKNHTMLKQ